MYAVTRLEDEYTSTGLELMRSELATRSDYAEHSEEINRSVAEASAREEATSAKRMTGLSGWLLLFWIFLWMVAWPVVGQLQNLMLQHDAGIVLMNLPLLVPRVYAAVLIFMIAGERPGTPRHVQIWILTWVLAQIAAVVWDGRSILGVGTTILVTAPWGVYFTSSRRVALTFRQPRGGAPAALAGT